jgi:multicomponent K+:H+ antiporter subunit D
MNHLVIAPVLAPLATAILLLLLPLHLNMKRLLNAISLAVTCFIAAELVILADVGQVIPYQLGDWPPPFGINLALDRLSAIMLSLTAVLAVGSSLHAMCGGDAKSPRFYPLFQLQLMGVHGAFLTGDLFNLFVFFEILLIASYGLMMHGADKRRVRASLHYVILNLTGSGIFLIGIAVLYGVVGTLNMADIAVKVGQVQPNSEWLLRVSAVLLLVVFGLKAALFPLCFWLPRTYAAAEPAVAALFAIMTKVGVYSILRTFTLMFGPEAGPLVGVIDDYLLPAALLTLIFGTLGAGAAKRLGNMMGYLLLASVGLMMCAISLFSQQSLAAALYYMVHSTILSAGMFILVERIAESRDVGDAIVGGYKPVAHETVWSVLFFVGAIATVGLPPLSGFIGKAVVLKATPTSGTSVLIWITILASGLLSLLAMSRAGIQVFWAPADDGDKLPNKTACGEPSVGIVRALLPLVVLLGMSLVMSIAAGPFLAYTNRAADQLVNPKQYIERVMSSPVVRSQGAQAHE